LDTDPEPGLLPPVPGLLAVDESLLGVFISHAHQDHFGLLVYAAARPRVFIGEAAARMLRAAGLFWPGAKGLGESEPLRDREAIEIGPFRVTPYLVDHSAYDAYALLVEADGERLFYSGDLRAHGYKGRLFGRLLREGIPDLDVLVLEGTTLGRSEKEAYPTEAELAQSMERIFRDTSGLVLVCTSGMNIDRLVTIYKAARRAGRDLILDMYAAGVLRATGNLRVPQAEWQGVRVFLPWSQKQAIKRAGAFEFARSFSARRVYPEDLAVTASNSVMLFRASMIRDLEDADCLDGAALIYSLWRGYLDREQQRPLLEWLDRRSIPRFDCHTSGHAAPRDLRRLAEALKPRVVVPVHSEVPDRYLEVFDNAALKRDGEWWLVGGLGS